MHHSPRELALKMLVVGVLSVIGSVYTLLQKRQKLRHWPKTDATVDLVYTDKHGDNMLSVFFNDANNHSYRAEVKVNDRQNLGLGSAVTVAYDPSIPEHAFLSDGWQIGLGVGAALVLGVMFTTFGIWMFLEIH